MNTTENNQIIADFLHGKNAVYPNQYHENWNELIVVVKKCYLLDKFQGKYYENIYYSVADLNIESVYNACVEFIKWYNLQNS